jgi:hypothetical protein
LPLQTYLFRCLVWQKHWDTGHQTDVTTVQFERASNGQRPQGNCFQGYRPAFSNGQSHESLAEARVGHLCLTKLAWQHPPYKPASQYR